MEIWGLVLDLLYDNYWPQASGKTHMGFFICNMRYWITCYWNIVMYWFDLFNGYGNSYFLYIFEPVWYVIFFLGIWHFIYACMFVAQTFFIVFFYNFSRSYISFFTRMTIIFTISLFFKINPVDIYPLSILIIA